MPEDRSVLERPARPPDRQWAYASDPDQVVDLYLPAVAAGAPVALVHGGYWRPEYDRVHLRPMAAALADGGHPTALLGYRRIPGDPDASVADLRTALRGLGRRLPGGHPVLVGHSAGGHLALLLASEPGVPVRGALALAPVADLLEADRRGVDGGAVREFLGGPAAARADLDPTRRGPAAVPVTVVHGADDALVPVALGAAYCAAGGARLVVLADAGHFAVIDPASAAWPVVMGELGTLAGAAGIE